MSIRECNAINKYSIDVPREANRISVRKEHALQKKRREPRVKSREKRRIKTEGYRGKAYSGEGTRKVT